MDRKRVRKIILYPIGTTKRERAELLRKKERITIQLRRYDSNGIYVPGEGYGFGNETIRLSGFGLEEAFEVVKAALFNSPHIDRKFDLEIK